MSSSLPRKLRVVSGVVLFAYVASHLGNLAIGLVSLEAMDRWRHPLQATKSPAGDFLFLPTPLIAKSPPQSPHVVMTPHHILLYAWIIEPNTTDMAEAQHE